MPPQPTSIDELVNVTGPYVDLELRRLAAARRRSDGQMAMTPYGIKRLVVIGPWTEPVPFCDMPKRYQDWWKARGVKDAESPEMVV